MDPLGLFTHGEFQCEDTDDEELLLFTHGEFGRVGATAIVDKPSKGDSGAGQGQGGGKRRRKLYQFEVPRRKDDIEAIATALLFASEDDDWDSWA
jgi:hypothetical protein